MPLVPRTLRVTTREGSSNIIKKNVISANDENGVFITGKALSSNEVRGNFLGTDPTGIHPDANAFSGVAIVHASSNFIGGRSSEDRNICSGNLHNGISLYRMFLHVFRAIAE